MNYKESIKEFKKAVKADKNITKEEWDAYAQENGLYGSLTLQAKENVSSFKNLKENVIWFWLS